MPSPGYSRTDVIAAAFVLVNFGLDVAAGFWPQFQLDPATRNTLIGSLTVLTLAGTAAYIKNRSIKYQAGTAVAVAQTTAAPPTPQSGVTYTLTPVSTTIASQPRPRPPSSGTPSPADSGSLPQTPAQP